jgi:hypothetical protein
MTQSVAPTGHHHVVVIDRDGTRVHSRRVANTEPDLIELIDAVRAGADSLTWAIDLADGPAALVIALLLERGQRLAHLPGIVWGSRSRPEPVTCGDGHSTLRA